MGRIIGIDLGTTNSVVAFLDGKEPRIIPNDRGNRLTPSIVGFPIDNEILVGEAAKNQAVINASRTVQAAKRALGTHIRYTIGKRTYTPEQICSFILKKLKRDAETYLDEEIKHAVITVPAYFEEPARRGVQEAGRLAGLKVRRILNEPTAASIAYAYEIQNNSNILVYDLGGGTFDVTYLKKRDHTFTVLSTKGNNRLGGIDFDAMLLNKVVGEFTKESGIDVGRDTIILQQLSDLVERAKIELSSRDSAFITLPFIGKHSSPVHLSFPINRKEFEDIIRESIEQTVDLAVSAVTEAGDTPADVENLILSGGSSRIPLVRSLLRHYFKAPTEKKINPEEVVALGAAIQASLIAGDIDEITLRDITPFSLGVEIDGGKFIRVLPRNSHIPTSRKRLFTTVSNNQKSVEIHVLQGEQQLATENTSLGRFLLSGIRQGRKGLPQIEVIFSVDIDGILHVSAKDIDTGVEQMVSVSSGQSYTVHTELKNRVESLVNRIENRLESDALVEPEFRNEIEDIVTQAKKALLKGKDTSLTEYRIALETIIGEITSIQLEAEDTRYG